MLWPESIPEVEFMHMVRRTVSYPSSRACCTITASLENAHSGRAGTDDMPGDGATVFFPRGLAVASQEPPIRAPSSLYFQPSSRVRQLCDWVRVLFLQNRAGAMQGFVVLLFFDIFFVHFLSYSEIIFRLFHSSESEFLLLCFRIHSRVAKVFELTKR